MSDLLEELAFQVAAVSPAAARRIAVAHERWGRGVHPASLNFGDCFAYEVAQQYACPLLFVGDDFAKTDIRSVL
jgi:ribonuclease VapC